MQKFYRKGEPSVFKWQKADQHDLIAVKSWGILRLDVRDGHIGLFGVQWPFKRCSSFVLSMIGSHRQILKGHM